MTYDCQATNGRCNSGCAQYFTGDTCQGNPLCTLPDVFYVQLYTYWEHALKTFEGDLMTKCLRLVVVACLCNLWYVYIARYIVTSQMNGILHLYSSEYNSLTTT